MHIDYITTSYSVGLFEMAMLFQREGINAVAGIVPDDLLAGLSLKDGRNVFRAPYRDGLQFPGFRVFWGGQDTITVEITGQGCNEIDTVDWLSYVRSTKQRFHFIRVTRIDVCNDYKRPESPFELVSSWGIHNRIKSRDVNETRTGQTFYVGARTSGRFCKVYRFHEPHPRHETCRVEYQFNKKTADNVAAQLAARHTTIKDVYHTASQKTFQNKPHDGEYNAAEIGRSAQKQNGSTVNWFFTQVAPALARLVDEGELTFEDIGMTIQDKRKS